MGRPGKTESAQKKLQTLMADKDVDLWAIDEVHFQQHGSRCQMWVPPEIKDPVLLHHPTRHSVGYFGAVRLRDGRFLFSREMGRFNALTFFAFLRILRRTSIRSGPARRRHHRQCQIPSRPPSQELARAARHKLHAGLPATL